MDFECRGPVRRALLHPGKRQSDTPHGVEVDCSFGHWSARFLKDPTPVGRGCRRPVLLPQTQTICAVSANSSATALSPACPQRSRLRDQRTAKRLGLDGEDTHPKWNWRKWRVPFPVHFLL